MLTTALFPGPLFFLTSLNSAYSSRDTNGLVSFDLSTECLYEDLHALVDEGILRQGITMKSIEE